jgi:thiol-disulfide isomerase/thioredoxin
MRKILHLIVLLLVSSGLFAQMATVKLKFINAADKSVDFLLPVNKGIFYSNMVKKTMDKDNSLTLTFETNKIAKVLIRNSGIGSWFYIEPGQTYITFNPNDKKNPITYVGRNKEGQEALKNINNEFYQTRSSRYAKLDSTAAGIKKLIKADEDKELAPFKSLLAEKKITQTYFNQIKNQIAYTYAAITAQIPMNIFLNSKQVGSKTIFKQEFKDLYSETYKNYPVNSVNGFNSPDFYDYASYYAANYYGVFLPELNGTSVDFGEMDDNKQMVTFYGLINKSTTGEVKEYVLALFLRHELMQKKYQHSLIDLYAEFKRNYPQSKYSPLLKKAVDEVVAFHFTKDFASDQKVLADYSAINSLDELAMKFKGKTVFVDIWATWCGPCKAEFEFNPELEKYLKEKGVEMLFISMDKDGVDQHWRDMIKYFKLSGNHVRTNQTLQQDLINRLWDGKGYSIPRYLILKDGKLVVASALRPSDQTKLYEQIAKYL